MKTRFVTLTLVPAVAATSPLGAQANEAGQPAAAAPAPPPGPPPEISVVGLRIVGAGLGKNREEIRAFNERPASPWPWPSRCRRGRGSSSSTRTTAC